MGCRVMDDNTCTFCMNCRSTRTLSSLCSIDDTRYSYIAIIITITSDENEWYRYLLPSYTYDTYGGHVPRAHVDLKKASLTYYNNIMEVNAGSCMMLMCSAARACADHNSSIITGVSYTIYNIYNNLIYLIQYRVYMRLYNCDIKILCFSRL